MSTTQSQSLSPTAVPPSGHVPALTPAQRETITRAAELIAAADGIRTLAELLQVEPVPDELYPAAFGCTIRLRDQVVAIVDDLTGVDADASCANALGGGK
jgi:hypothetical protein